jgi:hypothetical protein
VANLGGMTRRAAIVLAAVVAVVAGIAAFLLLRGDDKPAPPKAPPAAEPLSFMPADADVVFDLDTDVPAIAVAAAELVPRLPGATVTAEQIRPLVGGRMAVAVEGGKLWLAAVTSAPAPPGATKREGTVIVAPGSVTQTVGARALFDKRLAGLPRSSARVAFNPRELAPQIANTTWGSALNDGAAALTIEGDRIALRFRISTEPVKPEDLPIVIGTQAPPTHGSAPVVAATRAPAQSLRFLQAAGLLPALDVLDRAPGFLKPDLDNLGPDATITTADAKVFTVRFTPPDPGDWATKLNRLDALSGLIRFTGLADIRIDKRGDVYTIQQDGRLAARAAVYGRVVVLSTDPRADLRAAANAPAKPPPSGAAGALTLNLSAALFASALPSLVQGHVGDVEGWARAEPTQVTGELGLTVR